MSEEEDLPKLKIKFSVYSKSTLEAILSFLIDNYEVDGWKMTQETTEDGTLINLYPLPNEEFFVLEVKNDIVAIITDSRNRFRKQN